MLGLCGSALFMRQHVGVLVLGATLAVGRFTALPGPVSCQLFFSGVPVMAGAVPD